MKTKNVMLGIIAVVFAVGSAFASFLSPSAIRVKARVVENGVITCVNTQAICNDPGNFVCKVTLAVEEGPSTTTKTYKDASCTVPLTNTTANAVLSTEEVFELVEF